jgi:hypothetical protein
MSSYPSRYSTTSSDYGRNGGAKTDTKPVYRPPSGSIRPLPINGSGPLDANGKLISASKIVENHYRSLPVIRQPVRGDHSIPTSTQKPNGEISSRKGSSRTRTVSQSGGSNYSSTPSSSLARHGSISNLNRDSSVNRATLTHVDSARTKASLQRNASMSDLQSYGSNSNVRNGISDDRSSNNVRVRRDHVLPGGKDEAIRESPVVRRKGQNGYDPFDDSNGLDSSRSSKSERRTPRGDLIKLQVHRSGLADKTTAPQQYDNESHYIPSSHSHQINGTADKLRDLSVVSSKSTSISVSNFW